MSYKSNSKSKGKSNKKHDDKHESKYKSDSKYDWKQKDHDKEDDKHDSKKHKDYDKDKYDWKGGKDKDDNKNWELKDDSKGKGKGKSGHDDKDYGKGKGHGSSWKYDWKDDWHHGGTKDKVAGQTGAAKDDLFTVDNADTLVLDVLDNDPGSAHIWSIDQAALAGPDCVHVERDLDSVVLPSGALLSVNDDGTLNYVPPGDIAELPEGETFVDSFTYVIRMAKGALSSAQANVTINGTHVEINTPATFSGDQSGAVFEDGTLTTGGTLTIDDPDTDEAAFAAILGELQGDYGLFSFDLGTGAWTYELDNDNTTVQDLNDGESLTESLSVQSVDGSEAEITVNINGADEAAGPIAERWVLSTTNLVRDTDGATVDIFVQDPTTGQGLITIPENLAFGDEDIIEFSNMTYVGSQTTLVNADGDIGSDGEPLLNDTALMFLPTGSVPVVVVLIDFVGFDATRHLDGSNGGIIS